MMSDNAANGGNIIDMRARLAKHVQSWDTGTEDDVLIKEGLDLLSAYRSINDESIRLSIKLLVIKLAEVRKENGLPE